MTRVLDNDHTCIPTGDMLRKGKDCHRLGSTLGAKDAPFVPKAPVCS